MTTVTKINAIGPAQVGEMPHPINTVSKEGAIWEAPKPAEIKPAKVTATWPAAR